MEPPLSVKLRKAANGIQACCPELGLSSTGEDGQSALGQLASEISNYWDRLSEDEDFRAIDSHQEHYQLFLDKVIPFISEIEQRDTKTSAESEHPICITDMIRIITESDITH